MSKSIKKQFFVFWGDQLIGTASTIAASKRILKGSTKTAPRLDSTSQRWFAGADKITGYEAGNNKRVFSVFLNTPLNLKYMPKFVSITYYKDAGDSNAKINGKTFHGATESDCLTQANNEIASKIDNFYAWFGSGDSRHGSTGVWD